MIYYLIYDPVDKKYVIDSRPQMKFNECDAYLICLKNLPEEHTVKWITKEHFNYILVTYS